MADDDEWEIDLPALRMLRDCVVVRASIGHVGLRSLWDNEYATATEVAGHPESLDYRLTDAGRRVAGFLLTR